MNLQDFMRKAGAEESYIRGEDPYLKLSISDKNDDRFESVVAVFDDEPESVYVLRYKMSGVRMISHEMVLDNHNGLHTNFLTAYTDFIKSLEQSSIKFDLFE